MFSLLKLKFLYWLASIGLVSRPEAGAITNSLDADTASRRLPSTEDRLMNVYDRIIEAIGRKDGYTFAYCYQRDAFVTYFHLRLNGYRIYDFRKESSGELSFWIAWV